MKGQNGDNMTKKEAYRLVKQRGRSKLSLSGIVLLNRLIRAVYLGKDEGAKDRDIASKPADISIRTLAEDCGFKANETVCTNLRVLESEGLIETNKKPDDHNRHVYTVHLEAMKEWPSFAAMLTQKSAARRAAQRVAYAAKKGE